MAFFVGKGQKQFIHELGKCHGHAVIPGCIRILKIECEGQVLGDLFHRALTAEPRTRELGAAWIFVETRVLPADVAERILAELQYQTAEAGFV